MDLLTAFPVLTIHDFQSLVSTITYSAIWLLKVFTILNMLRAGRQFGQHLGRRIFDA